MTRKAEAKKEYITKTARKVFARKGFKDVTMKDIALSCDISRGGLYLYYQSTEEILEALLREDANAQDSTILQAIRGKQTADHILRLFLEEQKKELLGDDDALYVATYEYGFLHHAQTGSALTGHGETGEGNAGSRESRPQTNRQNAAAASAGAGTQRQHANLPGNSAPADDTFLTAKFHEAVRVIEYLIRLGVHQNVFTCTNPHAQAANMMFAIEGMKVLSRTIQLQEREVDAEIDLLLQQLTTPDEP